MPAVKCVVSRDEQELYKTATGEDRDHLAVLEAPCGLAVEKEENLRGVARPFVDVRHAEAVLGGHVLRRVREQRGERIEAVLRRADEGHAGVRAEDLSAFVFLFSSGTRSNDGCCDVLRDIRLHRAIAPE